MCWAAVRSGKIGMNGNGAIGVGSRGVSRTRLEKWREITTEGGKVPYHWSYPKFHGQNMQTHWAFVWWCSCLPFQTHFTFSYLFARDVAEHTFDSVCIIPWKFLGLRRLKARILPKVFLAPLRQCHEHYTRARFDCLIANLPNRAKAWSERDVKQENTWDDKQESIKQTST
jgi:hypothetical protein